MPVKKNKVARELLAQGKRKKRLSYQEINENLPEEFSPEDIEDVFDELYSLDVVVEDEENQGRLDIHDEEEMEAERLALEEVRNPLRSYLKEAGSIPLLTHEQEISIARRIEDSKAELGEARTRKLDRRETEKLEYTLDRQKAELIEANLRLVINIAKKYSNPKLTLRDLIQEGNIGLMKAVEKFRYREGYKFSTYATWWIRQAITRAIADHSSTIRVPVHMQEKINKLNKETRRLVQILNREPTPEEIAKQIRSSPEKVRTVLKSRQKDPISLESPVGDDEKTTFGDFLEDRDMETPDRNVLHALLQEEMEKLFSQLDEREEKIIRLRFGINAGYPRTLEEVGQIFNLTRERIRQIESKALEKLKRTEKKNELLTFLDWYYRALAH